MSPICGKRLHGTSTATKGLTAMDLDLGKSATCGTGNELGAVKMLGSKSRSSYTWLDRLRYLKGFHQEPNGELTECLSSRALEPLSSDKHHCEVFASEILGDGVISRSSENSVAAKSVHATEETTFWRAGKTNSSWPVVLETKPFERFSANGKANAAEPVVWGIRTSMFRLEGGGFLNDSTEHTAVPASAHDGPGGRPAVDESKHIGKDNDTVEPQAEWDYFGGDVFGMEDRRTVLSTLRNKVSRKSRRLCFLPKSSAQVGKETRYSISQGHLVQSVEASSVQADDEEMKECAGVQEACYTGLDTKTVHSTRGAKSKWSWTLEPSAGPHMASTVDFLTKAVSLEPPNERSTTGGCAAPQLKKTSFRTTRTTWSGSEEGRRDRPVAKNTTAARKRQTDSDQLFTDVQEEAQKLHKFEDFRVFSEKCTQQRSCTKRRRSSAEIDPSMGSQSPHDNPVLELAPDHPSKKPSDSLVYITYQVFLQAGKGGLTAREAASRIEESGLGKFFQGIMKPRIKIGKIIRNNPYYFQAGEGRYILCEAIVGVTQTVANVQPPAMSATPEAKAQDIPLSLLVDAKKEAAAMARRKGTAKYWAQMHANGWTRGSKGRHKKLAIRKHRMPLVLRNTGEKPPTCNPTAEPLKLEQAKNEVLDGLVQATPKARLKGLYKNSMGGKPCKRSDGKNWQCPLLASSESNYCEHHQKRMKQAAEIQRAFRVPASASRDESRSTIDDAHRSPPEGMASEKTTSERVPDQVGAEQLEDSADVKAPKVGDKVLKELWEGQNGDFSCQSSYDGRSIWGRSKFSASRRVPQSPSCGDMLPAGSSQPSAKVKVR